MLPQSAGSLQSSLNSINHILSTTPPAQLPYLLPSLVDAVGDCKGIFSDSQKSESAGPIHKYKTAISALLHGKSVEGRWAAVGLIKCTVDVGQWEVLHDCTSWVRGLLAILGVRWTFMRRVKVLAEDFLMKSFLSLPASCLDSLVFGNCVEMGVFHAGFQILTTMYVHRNQIRQQPNHFASSP